MIWSLSWRSVNKLTNKLNFVLNHTFNHSPHASNLNNLNDSQITNLQNLLNIYKQADGTYKKEAAEILNNLGFILKRKGEFQQAFEYYKTCLQVCMANYPPGHAAIANNMSYLGNTLLEQEKYQEAKNYFAEALKIYNEIGRDRNKEIVLCHSAIAFCSRELSEKDGALSNSLRALEIGQSIYEKDPKLLCIIISNYADTLEVFGELQDALSSFQQALEVIDLSNSQDKGSTTTILLKKIGEVQFLIKSYQAAEASLVLSASNLANQDLSQEVNTEIHYLLGQVYEALEKFEKALDEFQKARELLEQYDETNKVLINIYLAIARIQHTKMDSNEKAFQLFEKANTHNEKHFTQEGSELIENFKNQYLASIKGGNTA